MSNLLSHKLVQAWVNNWSKHVAQHHWTDLDSRKCHFLPFVSAFDFVISHSPCRKKKSKTWTNYWLKKGKFWANSWLYSIYVVYIYIHIFWNLLRQVLRKYPKIWILYCVVPNLETRRNSRQNSCKISLPKIKYCTHGLLRCGQNVFLLCAQILGCCCGFFWCHCVPPWKGRRVLGNPHRKFTQESMTKPTLSEWKFITPNDLHKGSPEKLLVEEIMFPRVLVVEFLLWEGVSPAKQNEEALENRAKNSSTPVEDPDN